LSRAHWNSYKIGVLFLLAGPASCIDGCITN
jgi:hypothetical protein